MDSFNEKYGNTDFGTLVEIAATLSSQTEPETAGPMLKATAKASPSAASSSAASPSAASLLKELKKQRFLREQEETEAGAEEQEWEEDWEEEEWEWDQEVDQAWEEEGETAPANVQVRPAQRQSAQQQPAQQQPAQQQPAQQQQQQQQQAPLSEEEAAAAADGLRLYRVMEAAVRARAAEDASEEAAAAYHMTESQAAVQHNVKWRDRGPRGPDAPQHWRGQSWRQTSGRYSTRGGSRQAEFATIYRAKAKGKGSEAKGKGSEAKGKGSEGKSKGPEGKGKGPDGQGKDPGGKSKGKGSGGKSKNKNPQSKGKTGARSVAGPYPPPHQRLMYLLSQL